MLTKNQILVFAKKYQTNEAVIYREYLQYLLLSVLYTHSESEKIYFKGGTALHLIFKAPRFSEDLDFTVELPEKKFLQFKQRLFGELKKIENLNFKERETLAGKRFLLTAEPETLAFKIFVNLDFSFREKVWNPVKSQIVTDYPVLFTSYVNHLSAKEILAEKIRAILTRELGRDIYDLWFLLAQNTTVDRLLIQKKLKYYNLTGVTKKQILDRVEKYSKEKFVADLRPFVTEKEKSKLGEFFDYVKKFLGNKL